MHRQPGWGSSPTLFVLLACSILLATCATPSAGLPTARPGGSASGGPDASSASTSVSSDPAIAWSAYAACLRANGVDVADPTIDEQGQPHFDFAPGQKEQTRKEVWEVCAPIVAGITASTDKKGSNQGDVDTWLAWAACLRQHGLPNYPDPDPNSQSLVMAPGYDKADPLVRAAVEACNDVLAKPSQSANPSAAPK